MPVSKSFFGYYNNSSQYISKGSVGIMPLSIMKLGITIF